MLRNQTNRLLHKCGCRVCQQHPYSSVAREHRAINRIMLTLNEKNRRRFAGVLAQQWGRGGVQCVIEITGLSRNTIARGGDETQRLEPKPVASRIRQMGGGRTLAEKIIPVWKRR